MTQGIGEAPIATGPAGAGAVLPAQSVAGVDLVRIVSSRRRLFANVALASIAIMLAADFALPASYSSSAVVMLDQRKNNVTDQSAVLSENPTDPSAIQNQIQVLSSRDLAASVVDQLGLGRDPEFNSRIGSFPLNPFAAQAQLRDSTDDDAVVNAFLKHLTVSANGLSTTITVTFASRDPGKAAAITNKIVDTYIGTEAAIKSDVTQRTTGWLLDRIRQLGQQVQSAEANVELYKAQNNLNDTGDGSSLVDQQLAAVNTQLVNAREALAAKEAESSHIDALLREGHAAEVSQIEASPLIIQLRESQAELIRQEAQLATRYGPLNPKMVAVQNQMHDLDAKIAQEVQRITGSVQNEVDVADAQVLSLEQSLKQIETQAVRDNMARVKLKSLEANAASTRSMYEAFVSRLREVQGQTPLQMPDVRVISHAPLPATPSWPPRMSLAAASLPAGILFGLLAVLLAERFDAPVVAPGPGPLAAPRNVPVSAPRPKPQAAKRVGRDAALPVLAELSGLDLPQAASAVVDHPASDFAQTMRSVVSRMRVPDGPKLLGLSSPVYGAQSVVAMALARAAALMGLRVILVDGNFQAPSLEKIAGVAPAPMGWLNVVAGSTKLSETLIRDPLSNVLMLPCGDRLKDPRNIWSSVQTTQLMAHLRRASDLVVFDGPSFSSAEWQSAATFFDAIVVVAPRARPGLWSAFAMAKNLDRPAALILTK